jgi:hypothetical protein
MDLEMLTEEVCLSMGLGALVDPIWEDAGLEVIRLLFWPALDLEICVTLVREPGRTRLQVVAACEKAEPGRSFWMRSPAYRVPVLHGEGSVSPEQFERAAGWLADAEQYRPPDSIYIDGCRAEACRVTPGAPLRRLSAFVDRDPVGDFAYQMLALAWEACREPRVRNVLAHYLGSKYPREAEPPEIPTVRLIVLGTPEERASIFGILPGNSE